MTIYAAMGWVLSVQKIVKIKVKFDGNSKRPSRYDVEYWIDGLKDKKSFNN